MKIQVNRSKIIRSCCKTVLLGCLLFQTVAGFSQQVISLYPGKAPGSEDWQYKETEFVTSMAPLRGVRNVVDPTLVLFSPEKSLATGTAVIVCPGGGWTYLEYDKEGTLIAKWLAKKGVTAFVLKYRVNRTEEDGNTNSGSAKSYPNIRTLCGEDGIRAIEYVREHAKEFGIDTTKVGIMGFSAGAFLTMYAVTNSKPGKQPNFAAPIYGGSLNGSEVPADAPSLFIVGAADDRIAAGSPDLYKAWRAAGKSAELHMYSKGGHGFGLVPGDMPVNSWIDRFYEWLKVSGF